MGRSNRARLPSRSPLLLSLAALVGLVLMGPAVAVGGVEGNFGVVTEAVPIELPEGPGLGAPELALVYSAASGYGNAGVGWSLPYSAIRIDLRDGVPAWSFPASYQQACTNEGGDWEARLLLDDMELVPSPDDPVWDGGGQTCVFRTRPDTFTAAVPFWADGSGPGSIQGVADQPVGWAVFHPDGTVWWYGDHPSTSAADRRHSVANEDGAGRAMVTAWYLHHIQDRDGNLISYWPRHVEHVDPRGGAVGVEVGLGAISWAARLSRDDEPGKYGFSPSGDSISGFSTSGGAYSGGGPTGHVQQMLADPGPRFPATPSHYYAVQVDWEPRPDVRSSWLSGTREVQASRPLQLSLARNLIDIDYGVDGEVLVDVAPPDRIRSWLLQYDSGTTGRSLLRRVWPVLGYQPDGLYAAQGVQADMAGPVDLMASNILQNPWEFEYGDSSVLDPDATAIPADVQEWDHEDDPFWLQDQFDEGGFAVATLLDITGDGLPDQLQHQASFPTYPDGFSPMETAEASTAPFADLLAPLESDLHLWVRYNQGDGWSIQVPGPVDPLALYATAYVGLCDDDDDDCSLDVPEDLVGPGYPGVSDFCALMEGGGFDSLPLPAGLPFDLLPFEQMAALCEWRSCAPYCELGSAVTSPAQAWFIMPPNLHSHTPVGPTALEVVRDADPDPRGPDGHDSAALVLAERYGVTRGTSGGAILPDLLGYNALLGGEEPRTKVRHVDGYAQLGFTTRIHDGAKEAERNAQLEKNLFGAGAWAGLLVERGEVHDLVDMDGDGYADRVLAGAGILENNLPGGGDAVLNIEPLALKDSMFSTELQDWVVWRFDPEEQEFGPAELWEIPHADIDLPLLPEISPNSSDEFNTIGDPRTWQHHHLSWLSVWESTSEPGGSPASATVSAAVGPGGTSASAGLSVGPVSVSWGAGSGPAVGMGPVSVSRSGVSFGPGMQYRFGKNGGWVFSAADAVWFAITQTAGKVLTAMDLPADTGLLVGPGCIGGQLIVLGDYCAWSAPSTDFQRQGMYDMNGDGRPDYVIAGHLGDDGWMDGWQVLLNNGVGFDAPIVWPGIETGYLTLQVTEPYPGEFLDMNPNVGQPTRVSHQFAGLQDMNGDGLPDFVFLEDEGGLFLAQQAVDEVNLPYVDLPLPETSNLYVALNSGRGFDDPVPWWLDVPAELFQHWGHLPALSSVQVRIQQSETYNDDGSLGIMGLEDFNGDGLPDYYVMEGGVELSQDSFLDIFGPGSVSLEGSHSREPRIYLNTGAGFATEPLDFEERYGSFVLDTWAMDGEIASGPGDPDSMFPGGMGGLGRPYPAFATDMNWADPASSGTIGQSFLFDIDGDGARDWTIASSGTSERIFSLQDGVPDRLTTIRRPGGASTAYDYAPARDFMDLPLTTSTDPANWDRFPAYAQVVTMTASDDGVTSGSLVDHYDWNEPDYDPIDDRPLGFETVVHRRGQTVTESSYHRDRERVGLRYLAETYDVSGHLWTSERTRWDRAPFDGNYAGVDNWHYAPMDGVRTEYAPPSSGQPADQRFASVSELSATTRTIYDPRNGQPACTEDDVDGDGRFDRGTSIDYDLGLMSDGVLSAPSSTTRLHRRPASAFGGSWPVPPGSLCELAALGIFDESSSELSYYPSGRPASETIYDETGRSVLGPEPFDQVTSRYDWYPNGAGKAEIDPSGATSWTLVDPVIGAHPTRSYSPPVQTPSGGWIEFGTQVDVCGITDASCSAAAHGLPASTEDPRDRQSWLAYDALGRPSQQWDDQAGGPAGPVHSDRAVRFEYERYKRSVGADPRDVTPYPATVTSWTPIGEASAPASVRSITFVDGLGRELMQRSDWRHQSGLVGQRVEGWSERDERGRVDLSVWPCFAPAAAAWWSQLDYRSFDPTLHCVGAPLDEQPAQEAWSWDPLDRATVHVRADGSREQTGRYLASSPRAIVESTTLVGPDGADIQRIDVAAGPLETHTLRFDVETLRFDPSASPLAPELVPDLAISLTVERTDGLGRPMETWRETSTSARDATRWSFDGLERLVGYDDGDRGTWVFDYDGGGRLVWRDLLDAVGGSEAWTAWEHDAAGRVVFEEHGDPAGGASEVWEFTWDEEDFAPLGSGPGGSPVGMLTTVVHSAEAACGFFEGAPSAPSLTPVSAEAFFYDGRGQPVEEQRLLTPCDWVDEGSVASEPLFGEYAWFDDGTRRAVRMPANEAQGIGGEWVETLRNPEGQEIGLVGAETYVAGATWDVHGRLRLLQLGNGTSQTFEYAAGLQSHQALEATAVLSPVSSDPLFERSYTWDPRGNLVQWTDAAPPWPGAGPGPSGATAGAPETVTCSYDGISRLQGCAVQPELSWMTEPAEPGGWSYGYDLYGNLVEESVDLPGEQRSACQQTSVGRDLMWAVPGYEAPSNGIVARFEQSGPGGCGADDAADGPVFEPVYPGTLEAFVLALAEEMASGPKGPDKPEGPEEPDLALVLATGEVRPLVQMATAPPTEVEGADLVVVFPDLRIFRLSDLLAEWDSDRGELRLWSPGLEAVRREEFGGGVPAAWRQPDGRVFPLRAADLEVELPGGVTAPLAALLAEAEGGTRAKELSPDGADRPDEPGPKGIEALVLADGTKLMPDRIAAELPGWMLAADGSVDPEQLPRLALLMSDGRLFGFDEPTPDCDPMDCAPEDWGGPPLFELLIGDLEPGPPISAGVLANQVFDARGHLLEQSWFRVPTTAVGATRTEEGVLFGAPPEAIRSFEWTGRGRLGSVHSDGSPTSRFWFDRDAVRMGKEQLDPVSGEPVRQVRFSGGSMELTDRGVAGVDWTNHYRFAGRLVASKDSNLSFDEAYGDGYAEVIRYIGGDHLGSATIVTDEFGELVRGVRYEPYGRMRESWGPEAESIEFEPGDVDELFNGKQRELASMGLAGTTWEAEAYDYGARFYMPRFGTWISADEVTPNVVWEANGFQYVRGNPLKYRDPDGRLSKVGYAEQKYGEVFSELPSKTQKQVVAGQAVVMTVTILAIPLAPATLTLIEQIGMATLVAECGMGWLEIVAMEKGTEIAAGYLFVRVAASPQGQVALSQLGRHATSAWDFLFGGGRSLDEGGEAVQYVLAKHGAHPSPRPVGSQSHHGVMSAWMRAHFSGYRASEAPAILMATSKHRKTFGVYNRWRARMRGAMGGKFDWKNVTEQQMQELSESMFDAADVPSQLRTEYWEWFERMKSALKR